MNTWYLLQKLAAAKDSEIQDQLDAVNRLEFNSESKPSEYVAPYLHTIAQTALGGTVAALAGKNPAIAGSITFGSSLTGNIIARVVGKLSKTRTGKEQMEYEDNSNWKNWLIPFVAEYNKGKSLDHYEQRRKDIIRKAREAYLTE